MTSAHVSPPLEASSVERETERRREKLAAQATLHDETAPERVALTVPRSTYYLGVVRRVVADVALRAGFSREDVDKIELAVDEACTNAIVYQVDPEGIARVDRIDVEVAIERPRFTVTLRDRGAPFSFQERGNFDLEDQLRGTEPGGLGIYIIKNFMDEVVYEHTRGGNVLTMVKLLA